MASLGWNPSIKILGLNVRARKKRKHGTSARFGSDKKKIFSVVDKNDLIHKTKSSSIEVGSHCYKKINHLSPEVEARADIPVLQNKKI